MKKKNTKYLLTLCFLLLSASGQLFAYTQIRSVTQLSKNSLFHSADVTKLFTEVNPTFISPLSNDSETKVFDCDEKVEEDKKEDTVSQKKNLENNTYISTTLLYSWHNQFFLFNNTKALHFGKYLSHFHYHKLFIVFQVFRI